MIMKMERQIYGQMMANLLKMQKRNESENNISYIGEKTF
jgi:hypothetical protein